MQIAEKWQLPPFRLGMCTDEEPLVELQSSRLAGLIGPIQRELPSGTCLRARKQKIMQKSDRRIRTCTLGREKARPVCSLSISLSSTSEPQLAAPQEAAISRGAAEVLDARRGKMEDSRSQSSSRERSVMRRKSSQI